MRAKTVKIAALVLIGVVMMAFLSGCFAKKYEVTGSDGLMTGLGRYREGTTVTVVLEVWATDTDYTFYLNGEPVDYRYDERRGLTVTFVMPGQDVHITYDMKNTMAWPADPAE